MGDFVKVARAGEVEPGQMKKVEVGGEPVLIINYNGNYYAVSDTCTHEEESLSEGEFYENEIECPRHGAKFDIVTGEVLALPAVERLPIYEVKLNGDEILICTTPMGG